MANEAARIIEEFDGERLVPPKLIRAITERIVEAIRPEKVILFGSYAYGNATIDSDVDLLVVQRSHERPVERSRAISALFVHRKFGLDVLVRTPKEMRERLALGDYFICEIVEKGQVLYERRNPHRTRLGRERGNGLRGDSRSRAPKKKAENRYPGSSAMVHEAREAISAMKQVRKFVRTKPALSK